MHLFACFPKEREGEGAIPMGNETILKTCCLITHSCISMWYVCFLSLSKIPCTGHEIGYSENTDEVPNFSPQGQGTLSNSWGLGFVCGLIPLVLLPSPPPLPPPHTHSWENTHYMQLNYQ